MDSNFTNMEEMMNINRRTLMLSAVAVGLLGVAPAFAGADEDAITKNLEAFRVAQAAGKAEFCKPPTVAACT